MDEGSALLTRSATGAKYLIALQVLSRAITFSLNQLLLRYISPDVLGLSVQYEVYSISVLFFARESLRIAIQRHADVAGPDSVDRFHQNAQQGRKDKGAGAEKSQALVNLAYIAVFLGTLLSYGLASAYGKSTGGELATHDMPYRRLTLVTYGLASMMELLAEPSFVVVQQKAAYKVRAAAELVGTFARCFTTCALVIVSDKYHLELGVFPFGISQWTYAMSVLFVYIWKVKPIAAAAGFSLLPVPIPTSRMGVVYIARYWQKPMLSLMATLFAQGFVKHILTQGDTLLIAWLAPLAAQGAYALASNYGGLAARLLFQPIEESSRSYFGKLLNSDSGPVPRTNILTATRDVHRLLRFYFLISLLAMALGPTAAPLLLKIVAGPRWANSGASDALALFAYYVPLLALNGILEAFVSSVASEEEVNNQSLWMLGFSFAFACAAYIMLAVLDLGAQGLVFSNMINMGLRIIWSFMFLRRYMRRHNSAIIIRNVFPSAGTMAAAVAAGSMLYGIQQRDLSILYQILSMVVSALMFLAVLAFGERKFLWDLYSAIRSSG